ncbi:hypothetical protein V8E55_008193 [Tylopilus felleus]
MTSSLRENVIFMKWKFAKVKTGQGIEGISKQKEQPALNGVEQLKSVYRGLPLNLPEEIFWQSVQAWVTLRTKRLNKEHIPSRAYLAFKNEAHADGDYISFLEMVGQRLIAASQPPPPPTTTPLLEALKAEKSAQKDKETTLQDPTVTVSLSKKEVAKKKLPSRPLVVVPLHKLQARVAYADEQEGKKAAAAAAQKASLQEEQGQGSGSGKGAAATGTAAAAPSGVKLPPPAPTSTSSGGHGARQWPPEEPRGHSHSGKGGVSSAPAPAGTSVGPLQGPCQCKNRPAALNGAGVAVSAGSSSRPGNRKRRDKGGNILQCPAETSARGTEGSAVHRQGSPGSPSGPNDADGGGPAGSPGSGPGGRGRGSTRRGRGRGRGGNHGE